MEKIIPSLSKMWLKVINLEQSLFPKFEESIGPLNSKEKKLIKILDFAEIERFVSTVQITNPLKTEKRWHVPLLLNKSITFRPQEN